MSLLIRVREMLGMGELISISEQQLAADTRQSCFGVSTVV
jgi:hypothetical protein